MPYETSMGDLTDGADANFASAQNSLKVSHNIHNFFKLKSLQDIGAVFQNSMRLV